MQIGHISLDSGNNSLRYPSTINSSTALFSRVSVIFATESLDSEGIPNAALFRVVLVITVVERVACLVEAEFKVVRDRDRLR